MRLRGMTWDHPRGFEPLAATAAIWREKTGVEVLWERRSLQDFEAYPVRDLARRYDLVVIDHPHVGQLCAEGCLVPLDAPERAGLLADLERCSVGPSFASYRWQGRQWALPVDAAAQVLAFRPDLLEAPPASWDEVFRLAERGRVLLPMRNPHALMVFYTLAANLGRTCGSAEGAFVDPEVGAEALETMRRLLRSTGADCFALDPIAASELLASAQSGYALIPLVYGYCTYARESFRERRLAFADIPSAGRGPVGATLGGTGIAVSAFCREPQAAIVHAFWLASEAVQRGPYAAAGGQPAHAAAWSDPAVNRPVGGFYTATRRTLEQAYLRPRHDGYMAFQAAASARIEAGLTANERSDVLVAALQSLAAMRFAGSAGGGRDSGIRSRSID